VQYVVDATSQRTAAQAEAAYYDDRRGKGYSVSDGMGPLTDAWRGAAQQTTSITSVPADATTKLYNDTGNNTGVGGSANAGFGSVVDFINTRWETTARRSRRNASTNMRVRIGGARASSSRLRSYRQKAPRRPRTAVFRAGIPRKA
ncbi:hypothetical protein M3652_20815, partial [Bacillus intestinalis]|nr:hypothetical protein [Bacillus spizizenii]